MKYPKVLILIAGLLLISLFLSPIWRISLIAPQYPDGVHMYIYVNKIGGKEPGTLQNINILNHYIGMREIVPDDIPELKYFPYVVIGFIAFAVIVFFIDKKYLYLAWTTLFGLCLLLALIDFYIWEYEYGHNLDPKAIMTFEGESFQPPLIGTKHIINFIAKSFPHIGGYMMFLSAILATMATYIKFKKN